MGKLYKVGIYARLSTDDISNSAKAKNYIPADESTSIENQKLLLSKFVMLNGWIETKTYADDGYGGGNFNRPAFKEMLEDAKNGIINLILVKDLSRLGRDYVEVGRYTDVIFPSLGCRFVALLDGIDTSKDDNEMLHFRSLMNDYHLKDLSNKIKLVLYAKAKQGQFLGAYAPYGYKKSDEDKHRLIIDEEAATNVRRIYALRLQGFGYAKIAGTLNDDGILSPRAYWDERYGKGVCKYAKLWMYATIRDILSNEVYIGHLINNRTGSMSYKDKTMICKPEDQWLRHENNHEAIISQTDWDAVQEINRAASQTHKNARAPQAALFSGKLFCMDCKTPMRSEATVHRWKDGDRVSRYYRYSCARHAQSGRSVCSWHTISEKALKTILLSEIQAHAQAVTLNAQEVMDKLKARMSCDDSDRQLLLRQEEKRLAQRLRELERITADLYEDKVTQKISEGAFLTLMKKNEDERQRKTEQMEAVKEQLNAINEKILSISKWAEVVRRSVHLTEIDRSVIDELIDHIEIGESDYTEGTRKQEVKVYFKYIGLVG